jgi:hypothetical protein
VVGACVRRRNHRSGEDDAVQWNLDLYDFLDNEQFSNFDCFLVQLGSCVILAPDDLEDESKVDHRKLRRILDARSSQVSVQFVKRSMYKKTDNQELLRKIVGKESHEANVAEVSDLIPNHHAISYDYFLCRSSVLRVIFAWVVLTPI